MNFRSRPLHILLGVAALAVPAIAQTVPEHDPRQKRHREALWAAPAEQLAARWYAAAPAERDALTDAVVEGGSGVLQFPGTDALTGGHGVQRGSLADLARSIDAQVVPGAYEVGSETPLRVRLWPWRAAGVPGALRLSIHWLDANGELVPEPARATTVDAGAFRTPGFDLFLSPPAEAGVHRFRIVYELLDGDGARATGPVFEVEGVPGLDVRLAAVRRRFADGDLPVPLLAPVRDALDLVDAGTRSPLGGSIGRLIDEVEGSGDVDLLAVRGAANLARHEQAWRIAPTDPQGTVLLIAPDKRAPDAVLRGARGAAWRTFCVATGFACVSTGEHALDDLSGELARLGIDRDRPVIVAPRGSAGLRALLALVGPEPVTDVAWVLVRGGSGALPRAVAKSFRGLWLLDSDRVDPEDPNQAPRGSSPLATDFALPQRLAAWIQGGGSFGPQDQAAPR